MTHDDIWQVRFRQATRRVQELEEEVARLKASAPTLGSENVAEAAACIADSFTCGTCGMDGKAGARIREILGDPMGSVTVRHGLAPQPQAAEPKGLTDDEIIEIASHHVESDGWMNGDGILNFARALLAKGE